MLAEFMAVILVRSRGPWRVLCGGAIRRTACRLQRPEVRRCPYQQGRTAGHLHRVLWPVNPTSTISSTEESGARRTTAFDPLSHTDQSCSDLGRTACDRRIPSTHTGTHTVRPPCTGSPGVANGAICPRLARGHCPWHRATTEGDVRPWLASRCGRQAPRTAGWTPAPAG